MKTFTLEPAGQDVDENDQLVDFLAYQLWTGDELTQEGRLPASRGAAFIQEMIGSGYTMGLSAQQKKLFAEARRKP